VERDQKLSGSCNSGDSPHPERTAAASRGVHHPVAQLEPLPNREASPPLPPAEGPAAPPWRCPLPPVAPSATSPPQISSACQPACQAGQGVISAQLQPALSCSTAHGITITSPGITTHRRPWGMKVADQRHTPQPIPCRGSCAAACVHGWRLAGSRRCRQPRRQARSYTRSLSSRLHAPPLLQMRGQLGVMHWLRQHAPLPLQVLLQLAAAGCSWLQQREQRHKGHPQPPLAASAARASAVFTASGQAGSVGRSGRIPHARRLWLC
jgi:hypothetical protein